MTPEAFSRIGAALFGPTHWFPPMAAALNVSGRRVRVWADGREPIPDSVHNDLRNIAAQRIAEIGELLQGDLRL